MLNLVHPRVVLHRGFKPIFTNWRSWTSDRPSCVLGTGNHQDSYVSFSKRYLSPSKHTWACWSKTHTCRIQTWFKSDVFPNVSLHSIWIHCYKIAPTSRPDVELISLTTWNAVRKAKKGWIIIITYLAHAICNVAYIAVDKNLRIKYQGLHYLHKLNPPWLLAGHALKILESSQHVNQCQVDYGQKKAIHMLTQVCSDSKFGACDHKSWPSNEKLQFVHVWVWYFQYSVIHTQLMCACSCAMCHVRLPAHPLMVQEMHATSTALKEFSQLP